MAISNINSLSLDPSGGFPASATATVATDQSTSSTSYTDLATVGPAVTVTTGTKALVTVTTRVSNSLGVSGNVYAGFAVSGATTIAAIDAYSVGWTVSAAPMTSATYLLTGLTAGSNTFTLKYKTNGGTSNFQNRHVTVVDMGS